MNNYCRNCGSKIENSIRKCPICEAEVFEERINVEKTKAELENCHKNENKFVLITIVLAIVGIFGFPFLPRLLGPLILVSPLFILIYAKNKYQYSEKIERLYNVFNVLILLFFIYVTVAFLFLILTCTGGFDRGWYV